MMFLFGLCVVLVVAWITHDQQSFDYLNRRR